MQQYQIQISDEHPAQTWRPLSEPLIPIEAIRQIVYLKYQHDGKSLRLFDLKSGEQVGRVRYVEARIPRLTVIVHFLKDDGGKSKKQFLIDLLNAHLTLEAAGKALAGHTKDALWRGVSASTMRRWIKQLHIKKRRACLDCRWEYWGDDKVVGRIGSIEQEAEQLRLGLGE